MNSISLYDSYQKKIVSFSPDSTVQKGVLKIYSCGPTVYNYMHIGNLRATWLPDVIAKTAKMRGYQVEWVQNITDVGHLVDDGDDGQDKMEKGAKRENKTVTEIVDFYTEDFKKQCQALNISLPMGKFQPKASEYIKEQMILALELLRDGKAYVLDDGIYYKSEKGEIANQDSPSQKGWQTQSDGVVLRDSDDVITKIVSQINNLQAQNPNKPIIITIDGLAGSGKSTLAKNLIAKFENAVYFNLDAYSAEGGDLFKQSNIDKNFEIDFENKEYDIKKITSEIDKNQPNLVILDGCFSFKNLVGIKLDLKIWVEAKKEIALQRLLKREFDEDREIGKDIIELSSQKWQEAEDRYLLNFNPKDKADFVISTENDDYEIAGNKTEYTDLARNTSELIQKWWASKFPNTELKKIKLFDNGMVCNFNLNDTWLLKILAPRYTWDKRNTERFGKFYKNYCDIKSLNLEYVPPIEITEISEIFNAPVVLMKLVDGRDLSELYHQISSQEKLRYLDKFINLIKALNSNKSETNTNEFLTHQDLHLGNILVDKTTDNLWLIDFGNLAFGDIEDEFYGILQGFLLPAACASEELEKFYPKPLYNEFVEIVKTYPELLPQDIDKIKTVFKDCFDEKLEINKFTNVLKPLYKLVYENNLFELLIEQKYTEVLDLFEKEFAEKPNYTGREIVNTTKNPEDFALWKFVEENALQKWKFNQEPETEKLMAGIYQNNTSIDPNLPNRWGCPGWHSECVAMICSILGTDRFFKNNDFDYTNGLDLNTAVIDIHTGGEDHIDIHHKNEILQSNSLGLKLSQTWVHNKFVLVDDKKMAKSVGNVFMVTGDYQKTGFYSITKPPLAIVNHIEKKYNITSFDPLSYRLLLLEHHYTEQINFTWEKLEQSQNRLWNIRKEMAKVQSFARLNNIQETVEDKQIQVLLNYLTDNLNIPKFLEKYQSFLLDVTTEISKNQTLNPKNLGALNYFEKEFLNLNLNPNLSTEILELGQKRLEAKQQKDYPKSDQIRNEILSLGFQIDDYNWGYGFWSRG